jgi:hypothetical protein
MMTPNIKVYLRIELLEEVSGTKVSGVAVDNEDEVVELPKTAKEDAEEIACVGVS